MSINYKYSLRYLNIKISENSNSDKMNLNCYINKQFGIPSILLILCLTIKQVLSLKILFI